MMALGIGILPAIKVYLRYPATITQNMASNFVFAPVAYESPCQFSCGGNEIQFHEGLTAISNLSQFLRIIAVFCLPKNNDAIVTVSDDGTNVLFGLRLYVSNCFNASHSFT